MEMERQRASVNGGDPGNQCSTSSVGMGHRPFVDDFPSNCCWKFRAEKAVNCQQKKGDFLSP